jgi:hypothetical protein
VRLPISREDDAKTRHQLKCLGKSRTTGIRSWGAFWVSIHVGGGLGGPKICAQNLENLGDKFGTALFTKGSPGRACVAGGKLGVRPHFLEDVSRNRDFGRLRRIHSVQINNYIVQQA